MANESIVSMQQGLSKNLLCWLWLRWRRFSVAGGAKGLVSAPAYIKMKFLTSNSQHLMATQFYYPFSPKEGILGVWSELIFLKSLLDQILTVGPY